MDRPMTQKITEVKIHDPLSSRWTWQNTRPVYSPFTSPTLSWPNVVCGVDGNVPGWQCSVHKDPANVRIGIDKRKSTPHVKWKTQDIYLSSTLEMRPRVYWTSNYDEQTFREMKCRLSNMTVHLERRSPGWGHINFSFCLDIKHLSQITRVPHQHRLKNLRKPTETSSLTSVLRLVTERVRSC